MRLQLCKKDGTGKDLKEEKSGTAKTTHSNTVVAVVPPPASPAKAGDVTLRRKSSFQWLNELASSRAHSRNYHNGKSTISGSLASVQCSRRPLNALAVVCCSAGIRTRITSGQPHEITCVANIGQCSTPHTRGALSD